MVTASPAPPAEMAPPPKIVPTPPVIVRPERLTLTLPRTFGSRLKTRAQLLPVLMVQEELVCVMVVLAEPAPTIEIFSPALSPAWSSPSERVYVPAGTLMVVVPPLWFASAMAARRVQPPAVLAQVVAPAVRWASTVLSTLI